MLNVIVEEPVNLEIDEEAGLAIGNEILMRQIAGAEAQYE